MNKLMEAQTEMRENYKFNKRKGYTGKFYFSSDLPWYKRLWDWIRR